VSLVLIAAPDTWVAPALGPRRRPAESPAAEAPVVYATVAIVATHKVVRCC